MILKPKDLYQTLRNQNRKNVLRNAPFICCWENAWLGEGFYFWDTFDQNAHWWGETRLRGKYLIIKMKCDFDTDTCFDLVGDTEHLQEFESCFELMKKHNLVTEETTVAQIINFIINTGAFNYQAIRAYGINSVNKLNETHAKRLIFEIGKPQYLDFRPAIQICIYTKTGLNLRDLSIHYPADH